MFREKLLICNSPVVFILADKSKQVEQLGQSVPVPVEVFPMALSYVEKVLYTYDPVSIQIRTAQGKDGPVITENGNLILDVRFQEIPLHLEKSLKAIPGVIESGLFIGYKNIQIIDN